MELIKVKTTKDIKEGDTLIITGDILKNEPFKVEMIKISDQDGTEIIIDKKQNRYFNLDMYLKGESWVKEVKIVR